MKSIFISIILLFAIPLSVLKAQESGVAGLIPDDYATLQLPPLETLFENSRKSAAVEYYRLRMQEQESMLKSEKRSWLKYFRASANYQYGKTGVLSYSEDNLSLYQYSDVEQSFYSAGGSINIPIDDLFDRPNRVKRQKLEMEATKIEVERWHDEQKMRIIELYTSAEQLLNQIKVKIETLTFARAQYQMAEKEFINGKIEVQDLSQQKANQASALVDYEHTRASLNRALLQLEILSKTEILKRLD
ncbi:MAG: TolC family protein [Mangrovibacterium sp.]|nr:TolC family protein [Mangrovibacterium sp.]